jgi:ribonuclease-3
VLRLWGDRVAAARSQRRDAKSLLQEWVQSHGFPPPSYRETAREGPDHAPIFTVEVRIESGEVAVGVAAGKRQAEQVAASELLTRLEVEDGDA